MLQFIINKLICYIFRALNNSLSSRQLMCRVQQKSPISVICVTNKEIEQQIKSNAIDSNQREHDV